MSRPMKHSGVDWLGDIPADWTVRPLKGVAERIIVGLATSVTQYYRDEGIPIFRNLNVKDDELTDDDILYLDREWASLQTGKMIKSGDILTVHTGYIGISCIVPKKYDNALTFTTLITTPRKDVINTRFLMRFINVSRFYSPIYFNVETGAQNNLNTKAFVNLEISLPPLDEQQRIANFLDNECRRIDSVIDKTRASIDEYKKLKQALITRAVTKGIRPNRPTKSSGVDWLGDIPTDWNTCRLRFLCDISTGNQDTQDNNPNGEYPFYVRSPIVERCEKWTFDGAAILMSGDGAGAGRIFHYVDGKYGCHQRVYSLQNIERINRRFLFYYIRELFYISIETANSKSTVDSVRLAMLQNFPVTLPPLDEQQEIAAYLDEKTAAIDLLIAKKIQLAAELEQLKKSLIFEYVTGKKELQS